MIWLAAALTSVAGHWLTPGGEAVVAIAPCQQGGGGAALCGKVERVLRPRPGGPPVDSLNPDPKLRGRPMVGVPILAGLKADGDVWRGHVYDPESGRTCRAEVARDGGRVRVRGCFGPFCRTQDWEPAR